MNKIHLKGKNKFPGDDFYKNVRFAYCGATDAVDANSLRLTDDLDKVTCLHCIQQLFKDDRIRIVWK